ncbi:putative serine hydrolase [Cladorrhinum sp. PSN259]|nr:putative serine hydrolase [Cladorrhinum sp. PSN259]
MKPKILLLHGSGTNPIIFKTQSRKLAALISPEFELVYLTGFHERGPGPGVLPFFEGAEPYYKWLSDDTLEEEELHWTSGLEQLLEEYDDNGPFAGVIGFSQGAKAGMYLVRRLEEEGRPVGFFMSICGTSPFQGSFEGEKGEKYRQSLLQGRVSRTQSYHVIGSDDPWRLQSEALLEFFDGNVARVCRFQGGHHMPLDNFANKKMAELIMEGHYGRRGHRVGDSGY